MDGVYTADPEKDPSAVKYDELTFDEAISKHLKVMDQTAYALCSDGKMPIIVFDMNATGNLTKLLSGEKVGTLSTSLTLPNSSTESIASKKLGCEQKYNVYLPAGYKASEHYPVIYLLHGLYGDYTNWVQMGGMKAVVDELMATGELCPAVIVMPNAGDSDVHNYQNGYFNVKDWPYEDFFFQEFLRKWRKSSTAAAARDAGPSWACPWAAAAPSPTPSAIRNSSPAPTA